MAGIQKLISTPVLRLNKLCDNQCKSKLKHQYNGEVLYRKHCPRCFFLFEMNEWLKMT